MRESQERSLKYVRWSGLSNLFLFVACLFFFCVLSISLPIGEWIVKFTFWVGGSGAKGVIVFALVYILGTVLFVPGLLLTLAGGLLFGIWRGAPCSRSYALQSEQRSPRLITRSDQSASSAKNHPHFAISSV